MAGREKEEGEAEEVVSPSLRSDEAGLRRSVERKEDGTRKEVAVSRWACPIFNPPPKSGSEPIPSPVSAHVALHVTASADRDSLSRLDHASFTLEGDRVFTVRRQRGGQDEAAEW